MGQYKKDDVKEKINNAALKVFAKKGYDSAKISDISKESNVSVGNIYKYYKSKEDIFYSVVPESFAEELRELIKNKIVMWKEKSKRVENNILMNESLTNLMINNRERLTILFSGSKNTKYESIREDFILLLLNLVIDNYKIDGTQNVDKESTRVLLRVIFENLMNMISNILMSVENIEDQSTLLSIINKYHVFGITGIIRDYE
jgi:AcrR family transcriptional regulator